MSKLILSLFFSFSIFAEIPRDSKFLIIYDKSQGGHGDITMAYRLAERIESLGFATIVHDQTEIRALDDSLRVEGINAVIHVPSVVVHEECLGPYVKNLPGMNLLEGSEINAGREALAELNLESIGISDSAVGLMLDKALMRDFQRKRGGEDIRQELWEQLTPNTKAAIGGAMERRSLTDVDFYLGYVSQDDEPSAFENFFEKIVGKLQEKTGRPSIVIFPGKAEEEHGCSRGKVCKLVVGKIPNEDFKNLLSLSKYALVTGDASLMEAFSAGVPVLYEVRSHKVDFALSLKGQLFPKDRPFSSGFFPLILEENKTDDVKLLSLPFKDIRIEGAFAGKIAENIYEILENSVGYYNFMSDIHQRYFFDDGKLVNFLEKLFRLNEPLRTFSRREREREVALHQIFAMMGFFPDA